MLARTIFLRLTILNLIGCLLVGQAAQVSAQTPTAAQLRTSAEKAIELVQRSSAEYLKQRECFSCHHQSIAIVALMDSRSRGLAIDEANLANQVARSIEHLERGQADYRQGKGQGGGVDTAAHALTGLAAAAALPSPTTDAVVEYLLQVHKPEKHWQVTGNRPPTQYTDLTTSTWALKGLLRYCPTTEKVRAAERLNDCAQWLLTQATPETEHRVFKLLGLHELLQAHQQQQFALAMDIAATEAEVERLRQALLSSQMADGGWSQTQPESPSDAYATATALFALASTGTAATEPAYARGIQYLLGQQQPDGSWHVATRSRPIQKYFESGFPHGADQFISMSATCWSLLAIQHALPKDPHVTDGLTSLAVSPPINNGNSAETAAKEPTAEQIDFFEREIRPLLVENCTSCHGPDDQSGMLRVDSLAALLSGGESGPAIVPGSVERSLMLKAVRRDSELKMPPDAPLAANKVEKLAQWIEMGAPWPKQTSPEEFDRRRQATKTHWAFQLPKFAELPSVANSAWPTGVVDQFVLSNLEQHQLAPHQGATRRELLRRLSYDLIGLPPSFEEVQEFEQDDRPDAVERVIDRLLASPKFGQQWGRHWLDIARYSDTKGYVYAREERFFVHAPAYRDWVVSSLASDMPYDQFVKLQLAADELAPDDSPDQAAMGFLTVGRRFLGVTHDIIDDRIDVVSRGLLGLTVGCARCHDHKFDPIPTADYYSLYGVFHNSIERRARLAAPVDQATPETLKAFDDEYAKVQQKYIDQLNAERSAANSQVLKRLPDYLRAQLELEKHPAEGFDVLIQPDDLVPAQLRRFQAWLIDAGYRNEPIFAAWRQYQALAADQFATQAAAVTAELQSWPADKLNVHVARMFKTVPSSMQEVVDRYGQLLSQLEAVECHSDIDREALAALKQFIEGPNSPCRVPEEDIVSIEQFFQTRVTEALWRLQGDVDRFIINSPHAPVYVTRLVDRPYIREPHVFRRGNPLQIAQRVPRQFLSALCAEPVTGSPTAATGERMTADGVRLVNTQMDRDAASLQPLERKPFTHGSGRRELAEAIVDPRNPLTARVWVNRILQHLLGQGLVSTPSDFGLRATPPSHPELLDRLALDLIAHDHSTKTIVRQIVGSRAYQQSSKEILPQDRERFRLASEVDPDNRWLWRGNDKRLSFEQLRDTWLAVSDQLDHTMGGRARPLFTEGLNTRRTIYGLVDRQFLPGVLRVFDFANPDLHTPQRSETTVPQQALFVLNHEFTAAIARRLEQQITSQPTAPEEQVTRLFQQVLDRSPSPHELADCLAFLQQPADLQPKLPDENRDWRYGFGKLNDAEKRLDGFTPLPYFNGSAWQGGPKWPDDTLGWVQVSATGGHAGNDLDHAAVRRWIAPAAGTVTIVSKVIHNTPAGDGIRAAMVHTSGSTGNILRNEVVHNQELDFSFSSLTVAAGDTLDFVVNINGNLNNDQFLWSPEIRLDNRVWNAEKNFGGKEPSYLTPWQQLAQVLLLSNELAFVD